MVENVILIPTNATVPSRTFSHGVTRLSWSQTPMKVVSSVISARLEAQLQLSCPNLPWKSTPMQHIQKRIAFVDMQRETIRIKKKIKRCYWPCLKKRIQMIKAQLCREERGKKSVFRCFLFRIQDLCKKQQCFRSWRCQCRKVWRWAVVGTCWNDRPWQVRRPLCIIDTKAAVSSVEPTVASDEWRTRAQTHMHSDGTHAPLWSALHTWHL